MLFILILMECEIYVRAMCEVFSFNQPDIVFFLELLRSDMGTAYRQYPHQFYPERPFFPAAYACVPKIIFRKDNPWSKPRAIVYPVFGM
jgi:hypothetical protein